MHVAALVRSRALVAAAATMLLRQAAAIRLSADSAVTSMTAGKTRAASTVKLSADSVLALSKLLRPAASAKANALSAAAARATANSAAMSRLIADSAPTLSRLLRPAASAKA